MGIEGDESAQAKGGRARADGMTQEERKDSARKAALARWDKDTPQASHEGTFKFGNIELAAAVLPNRMRLLTQATFLRTLGRSRSPKAGTGVLSTVDKTPFFLQADVLKPFVSDDLLAATTPIFYREKSGRRSVGYDARLLPRVAEVYLKFRDALAKQGSLVPRQYEHIVEAADLVMRSLATVGIVAMVDEATGFQEVRDREALQQVLDLYLMHEFAAWAKRFPDEFYKQIYRLKGWQWMGMSKNRKPLIGKYTNDLVYDRLGPGILEELKLRNPKDERGNRRAKHHQWLTGDVGHPRLAEHLYGLLGLMRTFPEGAWQEFKGKLEIAYPKRGSNLDIFLDAAS